MTCPCCGVRLKMTVCRKTSLKQSRCEYATLSQAFKGWQVTRTYVIEHSLHKDCRADYDYQLVQECWDGPKGSVLFQAKKGMGFWYCREGKGWSRWSFELKRDRRAYYQMPSEYDIIESVIPQLIQRGFKRRKTHDFYLQPLFYNLLHDSEFESYWKRNHFLLCGKLLSDNWDKEIDGAIKVYLRHNPKGWTSKEHISDWFDMVGALQELGKDLHNPHYVCPDNFKEAHDRWIKLKIKRREEAERRRRHEEAVKKAERQKALAERYVKERGLQFKDLTIAGNGIVIKVLPDVQAFIEEADFMQHCVCANEYYNLETHPNSLILSARTGDWSERIETIEVNLNNYQIIQSRGRKNSSTPRHMEIVNLVQQNMNLIRQYHHRKLA